MNRKMGIPFLTLLILPLLVISLLGLANAQTLTIGVSAGDTFTYTVSSNSDLSPIDVAYLFEPKNTEWLRIDITSINNQNNTVGIFGTQHFKNGTEISYFSSQAVDKYFVFPMTSANLSAGDVIWTVHPNEVFNDTISKTYLSGTRDVNRFKLLSTQAYAEIEMLFDKITGMPVELRFIEYSGATTVMELSNSSVWTVPEFPSLIVVPILMTFMLAGAIIYKTKLNKRNKEA